MKLFESDARLSDGIYGYVYRNDLIPRFFVDQIYSVFCDYIPLVCKTITSMAKHLSKRCTQLGITVCNNEKQGVILTLLGNYIDVSLTPGIRTFALNALFKQASLLSTLFLRYRDNPDSFLIREHVGMMYTLDSWVKESSDTDLNNMTGCTRQQIYVDKFHWPHELAKIAQVPWSELTTTMADHDPRSYRHAIQDPACDLMPEMPDQFTGQSIHTNPFMTDFRALARSSELTYETSDAVYPDWMPKFDNNDDFLVCEQNLSVSSPVTDFQWTSVDEGWQCDGVAVDCNLSSILSIVCSNDTVMCFFNATSNTQECIDIAVKPAVEENRCMAPPGHNCFVRSKKSQNKSSSGCSSNTKPHSSSKSSKRGSCGSSNDNTSGSSKKGASSTKGSTYYACDEDPVSCSTDLGDFVVTAVYLGGNACVDFEPGYAVMRGARSLFGKAIPAPNFQHTAIWFGENDNGNESIGAILVYGEYYNPTGDPTYLSCDGAQSFIMTLGEFKETFQSFPIKKMRPGRNLTLTRLLSEVKDSGDWGVYDYNWLTNNCQHFTAAVLNVLEAKRMQRSDNDWADIPPPIMNTLLRLELTY